MQTAQSGIYQGSSMKNNRIQNNSSMGVQKGSKFSKNKAIEINPNQNNEYLKGIQLHNGMKTA